MKMTQERNSGNFGNTVVSLFISVYATVSVSCCEKEQIGILQMHCGLIVLPYFLFYHLLPLSDISDFGLFCFISYILGDLLYPQAVSGLVYMRIPLLFVLWGMFF